MPDQFLCYKNKSRFFMRTKQSFDDDCVIYEIKVPRALMEETPDTRQFEGLFNVMLGVSLVKPDSTVEDCIILEPERLSMQLLRLAYMAAIGEEGHYGSEDL